MCPLENDPASFWRRHGNTLAQCCTNRALDHELRQACRRPLRLDEPYHIVIFSDHHKGARNGADDFMACESTYLAALDHYFTQDYTLVLLGDVEELWEERVERVMLAYANVLRSEARFHPHRYWRISGNHDDLWEDPRQVARHLHPFFPGLQVFRSLLLQIPAVYPQHLLQGDGEILLVHGHQGTLESDLLAGLSKHLLPLYREFQKLTGLGRTSPSQDACLRGQWDTRLYRWAARQPGLALVAGHTHRPVWSSRTHLEKLVHQLLTLVALPLDQRPADFANQFKQLKAEIRERQAKYPPCEDTLKTSPSYFNSGCCRFSDGDITGVEIENGAIRLVKWARSSPCQRQVLEEGRLEELFALL